MFHSKNQFRHCGRWIVTHFAPPCFCILLLVLPGVTAAQLGKYPTSFAGAAATQSIDKPYEVKAWIVSEPGKRSGYLVVAAKMSDESYLYSLTQAGVSATKIEVATHDGFAINGAFRPTKAPVVIEKDPVWGERQEKHFGEVEFFLPIVIAPGQMPEDLKIDVRLNGQVCTGDASCVPIRDLVMEARFGDYLLRTDRKYEADGADQNGINSSKLR